MKKLLLTGLLFMLSASSMALNTWSSMSCTGTDSTGLDTTLTGDAGSGRVTINGKVLKVIGKTKDGQGSVTQNFVNTHGVAAYYAITPSPNSTGIDLFQLNAVTQVILATARLSCLYKGNGAFSLLPLTPSSM